MSLIRSSFILLAVFVSGCQSLNGTIATLGNYGNEFTDLTEWCLIGQPRDNTYNEVFGPDLNTYLFNINRESDEIAATNTLEFAWNRSQYCLRFYGRQSGLYVAYDAAGSIVSGAGGAGSLASGATSSISPWFAGLALAPAVLRDIANLDPQQANAFQALRAVSIAQCETLSIHAAGLDQNTQLTAHRANLIDMRAAALIARSRITETIRNLEGGLQGADNTNEGTLDSLRALDRELALSIADSDRVLRSLERNSLIASPDALALRLQTELQAINLIWGEIAASLAPTPEQTVRHLLASPLTLASRLVSGQSDKEVISPEAAAVRFDYSRARRPIRLEMVTMTSRDLMYFPPSGAVNSPLNILSESADIYNNLNQSNFNAAEAINWVVQSPDRCAFFSSATTAQAT